MNIKIFSVCVCGLVAMNVYAGLFGGCKYDGKFCYCSNCRAYTAQCLCNGKGSPKCRLWCERCHGTNCSKALTEAQSGYMDWLKRLKGQRRDLQTKLDEAQSKGDTEAVRKIQSQIVACEKEMERVKSMMNK